MRSGPMSKSVVVLGLNYAPEDDPLALLDAPERGNISVYARGRDYHDLVKSRLKRLAAVHRRALAGRAQAFRRHRAGDGEAAGRARRARLAGQAHQSRVARFRLMAVPRRDLSRASSCRRTRRTRITAARAALSRCLPDRGLSRALPARCAALHLLSHDRAQGPHRGGAAPADRQPHLWLRRLPRRVPMEQVRAGRHAVQASRRATRSTAPRSRCPRGARRCGLPRAFLGLAGQADRPRPLRAQRAHRHRQQRRRAHLLPAAAARLDDDSPLVRAMAVWAVRRLADDAEVEALGARHRAGETDADVRAEWAR